MKPQSPTPDTASAIDNSESGAWSPLRNRLFALLLLINLFTMLAVFMNGLGGAWVLTDITDSPAAVATLQIAVALPSFLLALLAGALADVVSRKRIILFAQSGSVVIAGLFAVLSAAGSHSVASVLGLTAALGALTALAAPAWVAIIPGLVGRSELAGAMTLSSAGLSGAMALGPAFGGFLIAAAGPTWVFGLTVVVFASGIVALRAWKPAPHTGLPPEHVASAIRVGFQYVRYDTPLKVVIGKVIPFALTGTALMALLPAVARFRLEAGPAVFGLLSAAGGIGAVVALFAMPRVRSWAGPDAIVSAAMVVEAAVFAILATTTSLMVAFVVLFIAGAATLALVSTVMTVLQVVLPAWIRGRGVAVYLLALQGSFALGALVWGAVAEQTSLRSALIAAAISMAIGVVLVTPLRLSRYMDLDTDAIQLVDDPPAVTSIHDDDGPIIVTAHWEIDPEKRDEFIAAMQPVRRALKRQGTLSFYLVEDIERPGHMVESFAVATWSEYQRLPHRATMADKAVHDALVDASGGDLPDLTAHRVINLRSPRNGH